MPSTDYHDRLASRAFLERMDPSSVECSPLDCHGRRRCNKMHTAPVVCMQWMDKEVLVMPARRCPLSVGARWAEGSGTQPRNVGWCGRCGRAGLKVADP